MTSHFSGVNPIFSSEIFKVFFGKLFSADFLLGRLIFFSILNNLGLSKREKIKCQYTHEIFQLTH